MQTSDLECCPILHRGSHALLGHWFWTVTSKKVDTYLGEIDVKAITLPYMAIAILLSINPFRQALPMSFTTTVKPRNTGCQGTNKFYLLRIFLIANIRNQKNQDLAFVISGFPLLLGPV